MTTWETKEGKEFQISELSTEHIANIVLWLFRNAEAIQRGQHRLREDAAWKCYAFTQGECAIDAIESEISACMNWDPLPAEEWVASLPVYEALVTEARRRRICR